jgi:hypothetical protein
MNPHCVVTTINQPTRAVKDLHDKFHQNLIIVADKKTPLHWEYKDIIPIRESTKAYAPYDHYARKNLGYMKAIQNRASIIYDTDDDNIPNENWGMREVETIANKSLGNGWYNVYQVMGSCGTWPRGFSLRHLKEILSFEDETSLVSSSIQQGLADGEPDVDAIWRLVVNKFNGFKVDRSIYLQQNAWCPFNSQSTWWFPKAYPLMYLPIYSTFRMTDIWRSLVAQRCLWELGEGVTFHSPSEVFQDRNEHDLLKDFEDEIPGYLNNNKIVEALEATALMPWEDSILENLFRCYNTLVKKGFLPLKELTSLDKWIEDYEYATRIV